MTQSPVIPSTFHPSTIGLVQNYMDCLDSLPLDVQRCLTELREYDVEHRAKIEQVGLCLKKLEAEKSSTEKKKYMNKIQRLLINSQHIGDEKLRVISRIAELVENRTQMVTKCANEMNTSVTVTKEEEFKTNFPLTPKFKVDKTKIATPIEKSSKNSYDKPKRARRGMRTSDKVSNQRFNVPRDEDSRFSKDDEMEEEEEETEDFENDNEVENKSKRDMSYHRKKENSKVKYRGDEKADPRKEEKKSEKRDKSILKTSKKTGKGSGKMKKRKKKEKEISNLDEMAVDPDEPTYCICNSISYGDMIGCDNEECEIEWFHFGCVSLTHKPKGKWYCPGCTAERRELKSKK